ncbi:hypothetical protein Gmet_3631 [Geobacter metallireducens GS-15]|uniref:Uncharacterized protein n=1 Tax=Geobacter metallireducens (strain ATCC 53774 / DSM 7210 / GS-15) TaxID=269799 RepID=J7M0B5_GEOMG|nr:hypothetical protein Gmet_3631 [Geobacter metallireducens GS-15]
MPYANYINYIILFFVLYLLLLINCLNVIKFLSMDVSDNEMSLLLLVSAQLLHDFS